LTDPDRRPMAQVWVAGFCRRIGCGKAFTVQVRVTAGRVFDTQAWPAFCSRNCTTKVRQQQRAAERRVPMCWACWERPREDGWMLCTRCCDSAWESCIAMCRRKRRYSCQEEAEEQANVIFASKGDAMATYRCPVCSWWHNGHRKPGPAQKRGRLMAELFVRDTDPEELSRIIEGVGWRRVGRVAS